MTLPPCLLSPGRALLRQILSHHITVRVLALMGTCSTCDFAGQWLHDDGIPARSGVDGGVLAWIPGRLSHHVGVLIPDLAHGSECPLESSGLLDRQLRGPPRRPMRWPPT